MVPSESSHLVIASTGEAVRGFLNLRVNEVDRSIARYETALTNARNDFEQIKKSTDEQHAFAQQRAAQTVGVAGQGRQHFLAPMPGNELAAAASLIARVENELGTLRYQRAQTVWLQGQIEPSKSYSLGTGDLMALGVITFNLAPAMHGALGALEQGLGGLVGGIY